MRRFIQELFLASEHSNWIEIFENGQYFQYWLSLLKRNKISADHTDINNSKAGLILEM